MKRSAAPSSVVLKFEKPFKRPLPSLKELHLRIKYQQERQDELEKRIEDYDSRIKRLEEDLLISTQKLGSPGNEEDHGQE